MIRLHAPSVALLAIAAIATGSLLLNVEESSAQAPPAARPPLFRLRPFGVRVREEEDRARAAEEARRAQMQARPPLAPKPPATPPAANPAVPPRPTVTAPPAETPAKVAELPADKRAVAKVAAPAPQERLPLEKWPKPDLAIVITGNQWGYVEPCGCTGLENQKGGLMRRLTFFEQLTAKGWTLAPIDAGNQVRRLGRQPELQFQLTANAYKNKMGYKAIGLGVDDLRLSSTELLAEVGTSDPAQAPKDESKPFASANASILDRSLVPEYKVFEAGGRRIAVTSILGEEHRRRLEGAGDLVLEPAEKALQRVVPLMLQQKADYNILLAFTSVEATQALARKYPQFQLFVSSGEAGDPGFDLEPIEGTKSMLMRTGAKSMYVSVIGLFNDPKSPWRYERVGLDASFKDSRDMMSLFAGYQDQLRQTGLEGLGLKPVPHGSGKRYVGTKICGECHTKALAVWEKSPHAKATDSIRIPNERVEIPRHFDPECLSCHATGWEPQKFYPFTTGYTSEKETPHMMQQGCENCHGPGSRHVDAENDPGKAGPEALKKLREEMRISLADKSAERKCIECHDIDNSPDFHVKDAFQKYWKQVEHIGKD